MHLVTNNLAKLYKCDSQGMNERQTLANMKGGHSLEMQDNINFASLRKLRQFWQEYYGRAKTMEREAAVFAYAGMLPILLLATDWFKHNPWLRRSRFCCTW